MSWFSANERLSGTAINVLEDMAQSGEGEASSVAEALNDFAEDVDEDEAEASDETMISVAHNMIGWLEHFIDALGGDVADETGESEGPERF